MPEIISSRANLIVKQIRSQHTKKGRSEADLFLIEGIHPVGEATEAGWEIEILVYAPELLTSDFARQVVENQARRGLRCIALTGDLFTSIADKDNPQGILAIARQRKRTLESVSREKISFAAAMVSPQDPGNVGTILRTLEAVGAGGLFLLEGGVELYHPSVVRASMGALFWVPVVQAPFDEFVKWSKKNGFQLVGSSAHAATDYRVIHPGNNPIILLLGNEQKGLSPGQMAECDVVVSLPMMGRVSSLNLAVAAGVLLYQLFENK
jgi:RNA methyltransferase, TrmH family